MRFVRRMLLPLRHFIIEDLKRIPITFDLRQGTMKSQETGIVDLFGELFKILDAKYLMLNDFPVYSVVG